VGDGPNRLPKWIPNMKNINLLAFIITILMVLEAIYEKAKKDSWLTITSFIAVVFFSITVILMASGCLQSPL